LLLSGLGRVIGVPLGGAATVRYATSQNLLVVIPVPAQGMGSVA
jgi:hypothetical protein